MPIPADGEICFTLSVFDEVALAVQCCERINRVYPHAPIVLLVDQATRPGADVFAREFGGGRYNAQVVPFRTRLYALENGGKVVAEHVRLFLRTPAKWWCKIDPDTRINRPFLDLPDDLCCFGTLNPGGRPRASLQGGCIGGTRAAAEAILRSRLLTALSLRRVGRSWAGDNPFLLMRIADDAQVSFDFIHAWVCERLNIPLRDHPEIRSRWLVPPDDATAFAVSHPHGLGDDPPMQERIWSTVSRLIPSGGRVTVVKGWPWVTHDVEEFETVNLLAPDDIQESLRPHLREADLIAHLEEREDAGANFAFIPRRGFFWCHHFPGFWRHLEDHYPRVWRDGIGLIYQLGPPPSSPATVLISKTAGTSPQRAGRRRDAGTARTLRRVGAVASRVLPATAKTVIVLQGARGPAVLRRLPLSRRSSASSRGRGLIAASDEPRDIDGDLIAGRYHFLVWPLGAGKSRFDALRWHLESCYTRIWADRYCLVYRLGVPVGSSLPRRRTSSGVALRPSLAVPTVQFDRIREVADRILPVRRRVAVISRGDDALLRAVGRGALHFPQTDGGVYSGYHPADSREALECLHRVLVRGAGYLLVPSTAFWWLEHYDDFFRRLSSGGACFWRDRYCAFFRLPASLT